jgi:molybdopterin converting factor subunit 1
VTPSTTVKLFAQLRDQFGAAEMSVTAATVGDLRAELAARVPAAAALLSRCRVAVNLAFTEDDAVLSPADEVAVIPPVSGG